MATSIQTLADGSTKSVIKVISDGATPDSETISINGLLGAAGDGSDRVNIISLKFSVSAPAGEDLAIQWADDTTNTDIVRLGLGTGEWANIDIDNNSGAPDDGNIFLDSSAAFPWTVIVTLKKVAGFRGTALEYRKVSGSRLV